MENPVIIEINKLPANIEEFIMLRDELSKTAEGGAALFLLALKTLIDKPEVGLKFLVASVDMQRLTTGTTYKGFDLLPNDLNLIKSQFKNNPLIPNSYIEGTAFTNNYTPQLPYKYLFTSNQYSGNPEGNSYKLYVKCSGADSPRPIAMHRNDKGIWKANEWSSVLVGIKKSTQIIDDI